MLQLLPGVYKLTAACYKCIIDIHKYKLRHYSMMPQCPLQWNFSISAIALILEHSFFLAHMAINLLLIYELLVTSNATLFEQTYKLFEHFY